MKEDWKYFLYVIFFDSTKHEKHSVAAHAVLEQK